MGTATSEFATAARPRDFVNVPITAIQLVDEFPCDLYRIDAETGKPMLYRAASIRHRKDDLSHLLENGERALYVPFADYQQSQALLEEQWEGHLKRSDIPASQRLELLITLVDPMIRRSFSKLSTEQVVDASLRIGRQVAEVLGGHAAVADEVFDILGHDQYTFTHVVNVSSYAVLLADRLGFNKPEQLEEIAIAGLVHDVGKRFIPLQILQKKGSLTATEREVIQAHTTRGYQELIRVGGMTHAQLMITYQHHERPDGKGYPVGLGADQIHPLACLCAVVDVFDALTCRRPYRDSLPAEAALELMSRQSGRQFDAEMFQCWQSMMQAS